MVIFKVCCLFIQQFILYAIYYLDNLVIIILFDVNTRSFILITAGFLSIFSKMSLILLDNTSDIQLPVYIITF